MPLQRHSFAAVSLLVFWSFSLTLCGDIAKQNIDIVTNDASEIDFIKNDANEIGDVATKNRDMNKNGVCKVDNVDGLCSGEMSLGEKSEKIKVVHPGCKKFRLIDFNATSPTLIYLESRGRLGNQVRSYKNGLDLFY